MAPTLREGDVVLIRPRARPERGAVVVVRWQARPGRLSVKRAVCQVGADWHVEGDNTAGSTDSRELGPARVLAVVRWRLWPHTGCVR